MDKPRISKLTGVNYRTWEIQVSRILKAQGLYGAINGKFTKILKNLETQDTVQDSATDDGSDDAATRIMILDAKASTLIMGFCSQGPLDHIISLETAQQQWEKLKALYAPLGLQQLDSKTQTFINYKPRQGAAIATISTELSTLQSEIGAISDDERPSDTMKLSILYRAVRTLNTMYDPIVLQLGLAKITNYEDVITQLTEYERRLAADPKVIKENVFSATTPSRNKQRAYGGTNLAQEGTGHKRGFNGKCYNCGKIGHRKADCRLLHQNRIKASTGPLATSNGGRGLSPVAGNMHEAYYTSETSWMASLTTSDPMKDDSPIWVIDSGCSRHMSYLRGAFDDYHLLQAPIAINIANGTTIQAIGEGSVRLKVARHGEIRNVLLRQVLHVPNLAGNLISVLQLQDNGILTRTTKNGELLLELDGKTVGRATRLGKTYSLVSTLDINNTAYCTTVKDNNLAWHRRFGHLGAKTLAKIHEATTGLEKPITSLPHACELCIQSKMVRSINRQAPERALQLLERIHTDAWGPYRVSSITGDKYFFSFTDDHSRKSWVYMTNTRAKLHDIFTEFKVQVELETGAKIKNVRCDNISEYKALAAKFGKNYGIRFEFTTTYTPEQNGVSERLNRTLVTTARTMLADANLPACFWAEAIKTACYLRNRTPIGPNAKTPEEVYSGKKPGIGHLRAWGCVAYAHLPPINRDRRDKMHPVAIRTCLIGYMPTTRQYRLYDPVKKAVLISTAPRFVEGKRLEVNWKEIDPLLDTTQFEPTEIEFNISMTHPQQSEGAGQNDSMRTSVEDTDSSSDQESQQGALQLSSNESAIENQAPNPQPPTRQQYKKTLKEKQWKTFPRESFQDFQPEVLEERTRSSRRVPTQELGLEQGAHQDNTSNLARTKPDDARGRHDIDQECSDPENAYSASIDKIEIPRSYEEAINNDLHGPEWQHAITTELTMLQALDTWEYATLPAGKHMVGHKWVFTVKYTPTGQLDRFKARLTAQGFSQVYGEDFLETFSPTMRGDSLRVLLAIAAYENLSIRQVDIVSAYPRSKLHANVYMRPPKGIHCPPGNVLRLKKSLYGLKQSGREWYIEACHGLESIGLRPTAIEPSIFTLEDKSLILGLYVDDMLILSDNEESIERVVREIKRLWDIKDMGEVKKILGLSIQRDRKQRALTISQAAYIEETLKKFNLNNAKPASLPVSDRGTLVATQPNEAQADQSLYQQAIGRLMWISNSTRFDIAYSVGQLSQHCNKPTLRHWNSVLQVLRYLSGTRGLKLRIGGNHEADTEQRTKKDYGPRLHGFCDADYAGDHFDRRSVTGHLFLLNRGPVSWSSTKQRCVATSTTEAEYIALSEASKQGQWLRMLIKELNRLDLLEKNQAVPMHSDNQACIAISQDPTGHRRTKHIDIRYHYIRELIAYRKTTVTYLATQDMIADLLTKLLPAKLFKHCIGTLLTT